MKSHFHLSEQGAAVVIADINMDGVQETVKAVEEKGGKALGVKLDVTSKESVDEMVATVLERFGRLDILSK